VSTTGPFTTIQSGKAFYLYRQWYRQKPPPYREPLPYRVARRWYTYGGSLSDSGAAGNNSYDLFYSPGYERAYNKAYAKFKDAIGETASLAVNLVERQQAIDMFAKRTTQLYKFARAMKSFRFGEAARALELVVVNQTPTSVRVKRSEKRKKSSWERAKAAAMQPQKFPGQEGYNGFRKPRYRKADDSWEIPLKRNAKAYGSNYLEFHFGWEPLMKDIEASLDIFNNPMWNKVGLPVKGYGQESDTVGPSSHPNFAIRSYYTFSSGVVLRARVKVVDADIHRLEQLGLLNPAVLAWELVPFSFVVDWFVNVGNYLAGMTDFMGLELKYPQTSHAIAGTEDVKYNFNGGMLLNAHYATRTLERTTGISGPFLSVRSLKAPSVTRGVTAVSLLTGFFDTVQRRR